MTENPVPLGPQSEAEARALVREIIAELAPSSGDIAPDTKLVDQLEYTSLALLELAFTLEDEFDLPPIDEETARGIVTVADVEFHVVHSLRSDGRLAA